ncbi:hypothetical protein Ae201684_014564 [Aphanomyces euteiches]|uniref:Uncharacterized protein n=1 Tax=Aphanomyces euteiches TaxID=100861 RepID=A0A6G0WJ83_9STRA|nr:hypothetical protein Ae201684_014564 [Aphanomyces euteiches]
MCALLITAGYAKYLVHFFHSRGSDLDLHTTCRPSWRVATGPRRHSRSSDPKRAQSTTIFTTATLAAQATKPSACGKPRSLVNKLHSGRRGLVATLQFGHHAV